MTEEPSKLIFGWLRRQAPEPSIQWLESQLEKLANEPSDRDFFITIGMAPRRLGKDDLALRAPDLAAAAEARHGWDPRGWSVDEAARILVLIKAGGSGEQLVKLFTDLCRSADVAEAIAFYRGLPLYPNPELLEPQAAEGVRSNIKGVFEAVAHGNPYPREQFDQDRWNQMVLKALFIGCSLHPIQGLDERANPDLARMLCDFAHERWAADRPVPPELWRCVGPYADGAMLDDLGKALTSGEEVQRKSAAIALSTCPSSRAPRILSDGGELATQIKNRDLSWNSLAQEL